MLSLLLPGLIFFILLAGFYSGMETAAYRASQVRLRALSEQGHAGALLAVRLLAAMPVLITTTLIGHNLAVYIATYLLTSHFEHAHYTDAEVWATICLTPFCFIFAETLPKRIGNVRPDPYLLFGSRVAAVSRIAFYPLGLALGGIQYFLYKGLDRLGYQPVTLSGRDRLREHFEAGMAEQVLSPHQHDLLERILEIQELTVRDVMIPLSRAFVIEEDTAIKTAAARMADDGRHFASLVDRSGQPLQKLVSLKTMLRNPDACDQPVHHCAEAQIVVDANTSIYNALRKLREARTRVALATGRSGTPIGIVTLNGILEPIAGMMV